MKDWKALEPDVVKLMNRHYTPGRGGKKISCVVVHHNAGVLSIDQIWQVWQTRPASAHYQVESGGRIGQLVWDRDTAWHAANSHINQTSIGIEVSNSAGAAQDWPITEKAVEEAAHLTAAVCAFYKLGPPQAGRTVRWHKEFTGTSCPYHLAPGGKYHNRFMDRARYWYDRMTSPNPTPTPPKENTVDKAQADRIEAKQDLILDQLAGKRNEQGEQVFTGWPQGGDRTLYDLVAALASKMGVSGTRDMRGQ